MSSNLKRRIEKIEEATVQVLREYLDSALEGRSEEDLEFFGVHGFLPQESIPGTPYRRGTLLAETKR